jgi:hypothetical protein
MCGRVYVKNSIAEMVRRFSFANPGEVGALDNSFPRYNGAPTQMYPISTRRGRRSKPRPRKRAFWSARNVSCPLDTAEEFLREPLDFTIWSAANSVADHFRAGETRERLALRRGAHCLRLALPWVIRGWRQRQFLQARQPIPIMIGRLSGIQFLETLLREFSFNRDRGVPSLSGPWPDFELAEPAALFFCATCKPYLPRNRATR